MIYFQKWNETSFEYDFLETIKKSIKEKPNQKLYFGFDYGFFCGMNIYYGTNDKLAKKLYEELAKRKINIRLMTNIDYDFDLIVLFGYSNLKKEREYLRRYKEKIMKALSFL